MDNETMYSRTEMMLGSEAVERLKNSHVAVFGIGGVGGFTVEALVRAGVGAVTLVDSDRVSISNLNRQIIATRDTVGMYKTEAMMSRIHSINPDCRVTVHNIFYSEDTHGTFDLAEYDHIADCIDSVRAKLHLIGSAHSADVPIISSMGTGNKLDPARFRVTDISKTHTDPLAKAVRTGLRRMGIDHLPVVFSDEEPTDCSGRRIPGSVSFVPSAAGIIMAGAIIKSLIQKQL